MLSDALGWYFEEDGDTVLDLSSPTAAAEIFNEDSAPAAVKKAIKH